MLVRMLVGITGTRNGDPWPPAGGTIDVPDLEAADLIANQYATEVTEDAGRDEPPAADSSPLVPRGRRRPRS